MKYEDIMTFSQRCEVHAAHQTGMIGVTMVTERLCEEIDELRSFIEAAKRHTDPGCWERGCCAVDGFKEKRT